MAAKIQKSFKRENKKLKIKTWTLSLMEEIEWKHIAVCCDYDENFQICIIHLHVQLL